jgi:hypothetical protein
MEITFRRLPPGFRLLPGGPIYGSEAIAVVGGREVRDDIARPDAPQAFLSLLPACHQSARPRWQGNFLMLASRKY